MLIRWEKLQNITSKSFVCGHCGNNIASHEGYFAEIKDSHDWFHIYICHKCDKPTFFDNHNNQIPGSLHGDSVEGITDETINSIYEESRRCFSVNSFTAAVLCCRKLLMNIAVSKGAKEGIKFIEYVEYLSEKGFVPPDGKDWVDHIRTKGNEATHEIQIMTREDALDLISFSEMLLKFIFEFPAKMKKKSS